MRETSGGLRMLNRTCSLLVVICVLHMSVMLLFYLKNFMRNTPALPHLGRETETLHPTETEEEPVFPTDWVPQDNSTPTQCPDTPPNLVGPLQVDFSEPVKLDMLEKDPHISLGGRHTPTECVSQQKVAIIIPFRNREHHLKYWLFYMHPILQKQQLDYGVYVIEQDGETKFNRAKLLNVGYTEALKEYDYDCFVFSDVDLIPLDDRNIYKCFDQPRHLSAAMDKFGFRLPYRQYFGGVSAMSKEQYLKINGFPNNFWGWGGEDDDIYNRLSYKGMTISRPPGAIGRCKMVRHTRDKLNEPNPQRFMRIRHTKETMETDGINSLTYRVVSLEKNSLYTKIIVDVGNP